MKPSTILAGEVLALEPTVLRRVLSGDLTGEVSIARSAPASRRGYVAVIPVRGVIEHRASILTEILGGTSIETIRRDLRAALADANARAIVLEIDSPGGSVAGVQELAAEIRAARDLKPVLAIADTMAASAAYWLAAQASALYVAPSGEAGSIGVLAVHYDVSRALEAEGITPTIVSSDPRKVELTDLEPLSDDARAVLQHRIDAFYAQFVWDVARGRGVDTGTVLARYGGGRMLLARDALAAGLVDGIAELGEVVSFAATAARPAPKVTPAPRAAATGSGFLGELEAAGLARDGLMMRTMVHEAGHALAAARVGMPPLNVSAFDTHEGLTAVDSASADLATLPVAERPAAARRLMTMLRAGEAAVEVAGVSDNPAAGANSDRARALELATEYGLADPQAESDAAYARALELLREDGAEPLARMTAALNANGGRLAGPEVLEALRDAHRASRLVEADRAARREVDTEHAIAQRVAFETEAARRRAAGEDITPELSRRLWREAGQAAQAAQ